MAFSDLAPMIVNVLAGFMLAVGVFMLGRVRVRSLLRFFAAQSFCLAAIAVLSAFVAEEKELLVSAALILAVKVVFIPFFMIRLMAKGGIPERLRSILRPTASLFIGLLTAIMGFYLSARFMPDAGAHFFVAASAVAIVFLGLLMLMTRKGLYGQIAGFLMMENGIFALGLALTGGMPLIVEVGVVFDVTIGAVIMSLLSYAVHNNHSGAETDSLETLTD